MKAKVLNLLSRKNYNCKYTETLAEVKKVLWGGGGIKEQ